MTLDLIIPVAGFLVGFVGIALGVRWARYVNTRRRRTELKRARDAHFEEINKTYRNR